MNSGMPAPETEGFARTGAESQHLPSDSGPAKDCRHGGPTFGKKNAQFMTVMVGSIDEMVNAHNEAVRRVQAGVASLSDVACAELDALFQYWSRPERASSIEPDSWRIPFAIAVDPVLDSDFNVARTFVRTGAFLRDWAEHGGVRMLADYTTASEDPDLLAKYAETARVLRKTRTDRGIVLYLARQVTCKCLDAASRGAAVTPQTGKCQTCQTQLPKAQLKNCARCGMVEYCSRACQKANWKDHKRTCRPRRGSDS